MAINKMNNKENLWLDVALLLGVHATSPWAISSACSIMRTCVARTFLRVLHQIRHSSSHPHQWVATGILLKHYQKTRRYSRDGTARANELLVQDLPSPYGRDPGARRVGQIDPVNEFLKQHRVKSLTGLASERVWESTVVPACVEAGIQYVTVDDYHFMCTARLAC